MQELKKNMVHDMEHHQERILKKFKFLCSKEIVISFTGAHSLNRLTIGIWRCSQTGLQIVSEALKVNTHAGLFAKQGMLRIKKLKDDVEVDFKEQKKSRKSQQINQRSKENLILKSLRKQQ